MASSKTQYADEAPFSHHTSGKNDPAWFKHLEVTRYPKLESNTECDVIIVGAGISGLTCAYMLSTQGKSVVVLDDGDIASGESGRTTAHLANGLDDRYFELEKLFGKEGARMAAESHTAAISLIETIVKNHKIDCEFTRCDGYLFLHPDDDPSTLQKEFDAAKRAGLDVEFVSRIPIEGSWDSGPCLRFPNQAQIHPVKYLDRLSQIVVSNGGRIFTNSHVSSMSGGKTSAEAITTDGFKVSGKHLIVATNVPVNDRLVMYTKMEPYRTYVISARIPKGSVPACLMWDTQDPYHYVRITSMDDTHDLLVVGGEDHKAGQSHEFESRYQNLWNWTKERYPMAEQIVDRWSGHIIEPVDDLGYIGRNPTDYDNVYIITGDSGNGMTNGTIGGILITDMIFGRKNVWESLYDPSRRPHEMKEFLKANLNVGVQYTEWLTGSEVQDIEDIKLCSGAIIRQGLKKIAVYRDENGNFHKRSAVCPHLHAIVQWNDEEKSWDCPAHGSRFDCCGKVINGPSNTNLSLIDHESTESGQGGAVTKDTKEEVTHKKEERHPIEENIKREILYDRK